MQSLLLIHSASTKDAIKQLLEFITLTTLDLMRDEQHKGLFFGQCRLLKLHVA